jgi:predicted metal-dependent hydrolase
MVTMAAYAETLEKGIDLFNEGKFFEAHEAWEPLWLKTEDPLEKQLFQGLIMAAGAFHHYVNRACTGAAVLLAKSRNALESGMLTHPEIRIVDFLKSLGALREVFEQCSFSVPVNDLPKIPKQRGPLLQREVYEV